MGNKRQRERHFIAGLGDGNVRKPLRNRNDDFFPPEDKQLTPYIRSGRTRKALRDAREIFNKDHFSGSGDGITATAASDGPWQISAMALLCVMGLLVGLFLHLVTDSAEKQPYARRVRRAHSSPTKKKKTDEWSEDEQVDDDDYTADSESHSLYYPYHPLYANQQQQHHRHRPAARTASSSNSGTLHHRMPANTYKGPSSSHHAGNSQSPGPNLRPTRSIDSGTVLSARGTRPVIEGVPSTEDDLALNDSPWRAAKNARPLSPVSSFASMGNRSMGLSTHHGGDEELGTPPVMTHAESFDLSLQQASSRDVLAGSDHEMETPRAGPRQIPAVFREQTKSPYASSTLLPAPPEHEPLEPQDMARARTPIMLPYIPNLEMDGSMDMDEVSSAASPDRVLRHSLSEPPSAAYPGHIQQQRGTPPHELQRQASSPPERQQASNDDARKNIIHKREDITHCTDAESSLMGSVDFGELTLDSVIGGGGFGQVWKATWRSTPVAVKILTGSAQREIVSRGILEEFAAEINMLKGMRHPNICLYMGACLKPPNRAIITELASNGSLWDALRLPLSVPFTASDGTTRAAWPLSLYSDSSHGGLPSAYSSPPFPPKGSWPWILVKRVACGAARGMTYLHSGTPPVLHRDLKSANLLLDDSYTCKVCDFGLSRLKAQERSMTGNCGTVQWMAPEILSNQRYAEPADVYSFGIILWEMLTGECPYEGMSAIQCALAVLNRDHRPEIPKWCPPSFSALIRACWDKEPLKRPTFPQILLALDSMP